MQMKQHRLENLADGIFAIVMTLLVLDLQVPYMPTISPAVLVHEFWVLFPYLMSYLTSFAVLYVYWHSHHFLITSYAKNLTVNLSSLNGIFLLLIGLVPFSTHLLAEYHSYTFAIVFFSLHIIFIGMTLYIIQRYIHKSPYINHEALTRTEERHFKARIVFPVFCALCAILISLSSPKVALIVLTIGILFNFSTRSTRFIFALLGKERLH